MIVDATWRETVVRDNVLVGPEREGSAPLSIARTAGEPSFISATWTVTNSGVGRITIKACLTLLQGVDWLGPSDRRNSNSNLSKWIGSTYQSIMESAGENAAEEIYSSPANLAELGQHLLVVGIVV